MDDKLDKLLKEMMSLALQIQMVEKMIGWQRCTLYEYSQWKAERWEFLPLMALTMAFMTI